MTAPLNEEVLQRVADLGTTQWSGTTYRTVSSRRDPLSGEGARRMGGRWNPPGFATIYLASPVGTCLGELERTSTAGGTTVASRLKAGIKLYTVEALKLEVLDLRTPEALDQVGLSSDDFVDDDHTACQSVGHAATFLGCHGVLAPSATGTGLVLAAYEPRLGPGQLTVSEERDLTTALYESLS
ncbi:RES domain-containing protein [Kineococcus aurantiacus]|uniref:RES domain-containing protein n=1 Tax=Kineococcus aurantiacus TaxID=37633 RepID=A0A7Y9DQN3_9ACTN|nr:RES domain-containing protein [Kineococcus aurantiacus]